MLSLSCTDEINTLVLGGGQPQPLCFPPRGKQDPKLGLNWGGGGQRAEQSANCDWLLPHEGAAAASPRGSALGAGCCGEPRAPPMALCVGQRCRYVLPHLHPAPYGKLSPSLGVGQAGATCSSRGQMAGGLQAQAPLPRCSLVPRHCRSLGDAALCPRVCCRCPQWGNRDALCSRLQGDAGVGRGWDGLGWDGAVMGTGAYHPEGFAAPVLGAASRLGGWQEQQGAPAATACLHTTVSPPPSPVAPPLPEPNRGLEPLPQSRVRGTEARDTAGGHRTQFIDTPPAQHRDAGGPGGWISLTVTACIRYTGTGSGHPSAMLPTAHAGGHGVGGTGRGGQGVSSAPPPRLLQLPPGPRGREFGRHSHGESRERTRHSAARHGEGGTCRGCGPPQRGPCSSNPLWPREQFKTCGGGCRRGRGSRSGCAAEGRAQGSRQRG